MNKIKKDILPLLSLLASVIAIIGAIYALMSQYHQVSINKEGIEQIEKSIDFKIEKIKQELGISYSMWFQDKKYTTSDNYSKVKHTIDNLFNEITEDIRSGKIDKLNRYYSSTYQNAQNEINQWNEFSLKEIFFSVDNITVIDDKKIITEITAIVIPSGVKWGFVCILEKSSLGNWLITK